ncbi:unnamed protein product [Symbiodinium microadriaticum]|nr:unnamed protein product [Symbiodinium microadriaticum]
MPGFITADVGPGGEAECMGLDEQRWAVEHRTSLCEAPMEVFLEEVALSQLRAGEGICRKDGSLHKFGRLQTVKQSPVRPAWALELSLREVCKELVQGIRDEVDHIVEDLQNASFAESCAQRVVKRVEADILGCCADSCGWNSKTCVWWPFFSRTQRAQWEGECCAEQNILEGSERERMCDATLTKEQKEKLPRYSMNKDINGALIGQDRLVWMPSGVPHDRKDRAVSGDTVSNNFLLNSDVSARQGIHDKWWQDGVPATESSLLQHHYGEHGQRGLRSHSAELSKCLEPFKAMSVAQELAGKWMMIPALYFPTECGTPEAEGQGPDDLGEACMAFKQNAKGDPVCFDVNKKASQTEWGKVWHFASVITKDSADRLKTMRTLVFLKQQDQSDPLLEDPEVPEQHAEVRRRQDHRRGGCRREGGALPSCGVPKQEEVLPRGSIAVERRAESGCGAKHVPAASSDVATLSELDGGQIGGVAELRFEIDTVQELQTELHASSGCIDACFGDSARSAGHRRFEFRRSATAPSALPTTASRSVATLQGCDNALRHGGRYVMAAAGWHHARCVLAGNGASNRIRCRATQPRCTSPPVGSNFRSVREGMGNGDPCANEMAGGRASNAQTMGRRQRAAPAAWESLASAQPLVAHTGQHISCGTSI